MLRIMREQAENIAKDEIHIILYTSYVSAGFGNCVLPGDKVQF